ncbi:FAD-binding domain-containing protein [Cylindrobasidium torrendii FP15055 ss-10]|uniref:FAD-binding domain-containing protein n=1 Tax=Cylindrobasidium torrendii FP15055 ss-10 TaxID=1314674 RepID=A0A0D7BFS3_9AGAR|nr:FAD-binding domain-containing protein [Cylindrobasidium torrendii FP15055 ss-10]
MRSAFSILLVFVSLGNALAQSGCRASLSDVGEDAWQQLNASTNGRLVAVVPSAQYCYDVGCTDEQWVSSTWRGENMPGSMLQPNWEQDYDSSPPELCFRNTTGNCKHGDVPWYAVLAETVEDIQAGVNFARTNNLRLAIKASGHDYLGRSTAKDSLLISTHGLQNFTVHDDFDGHGSAVTVGSGMGLRQIYPALKETGKIIVGGNAATVVAAGGYIQGGGHSALSPALGLAADNALQFTIVTADGEHITADDTQNSDLFWALRGGGAGSWGVIVSATFRAYNAFNATLAYTYLTTNSTNATDIGSLMTTHAAHIHDFDAVHGGQYYYVLQNATGDGKRGFYAHTFFPNVSADTSKELMQPFLTEALATGAWGVLQEKYQEGVINDLIYAADNEGAQNTFMGSRLVPETAYDEPEAIGTMYTRLFEAGAHSVLGHIVAGGKVTENADIDSAIHPKWRTAKTHVIVTNSWTDDADMSSVQNMRSLFQTAQRPIMEKVTGSDAGSYSNEGDAYEADFVTTFFGQQNYGRLSEIKTKYDPDDLFIVKAGVGSERWNEKGLCKVA